MEDAGQTKQLGLQQSGQDRHSRQRLAPNQISIEGAARARSSHDPALASDFNQNLQYQQQMAQKKLEGRGTRANR